MKTEKNKNGIKWFLQSSGVSKPFRVFYTDFFAKKRN